MSGYLIARKLNNKEYYLENIDHNDHATWITDKFRALIFDNATQLKDFIVREFPNKDYFVAPV